MRALINALILFLIVTTGCFGDRTRTDGIIDGGSSGTQDTGVSGGENTGGNGPRFDAQIKVSPPPGICGDNIREGNEICDGIDLAGATCDTMAADYTGALACSSDCLNYDTSMCYPMFRSPEGCGNNIKESGEVCDGTDLAGETCSSLTIGFIGTLTCSSDCLNYDPSMCYPRYEPPDDDDSGVWYD